MQMGVPSARIVAITGMPLSIQMLNIVSASSFFSRAFSRFNASERLASESIHPAEVFVSGGDRSFHGSVFLDRLDQPSASAPPFAESRLSALPYSGFRA